MQTHSLFQVDGQEPLSFETFRGGEAELRAGLRELRFEYSSRGDRVPGRLVLPAESKTPPPLVLVAHGAGGSMQADEVTDCLDWAAWGAAVAAIDLPLHGQRASAKLSERLLSIPQPAHGSPRDAELWISFVCQAVVDLRRGLAGLLGHFDAASAGFAGFGLGASLGAVLCAEEPRLEAVALAGGLGGCGPVAVDPIGHIGRLAPRPLFVVNATGSSRAQGEALQEAAGEPSQRGWLDCAESELPALAAPGMGQFLAKHLA